MVAPQQRKQKINQYKSHTVKKTTYKNTGGKKGMMGAISGAAKIANALNGVDGQSEGLKKLKKGVFVGSVAGSGAMGGFMLGNAYGTSTMSPMFKGSSWTIVASLAFLAYLTRGAFKE